MLTDQENYNQRQYRLMLEIINLHKEHKVTSKYLISSLEGLIDCVNNIDKEYKNEFIRLCNNLDYDYLNLEYYDTTEEEKNQDKQDIEISLNKLIDLIKPKIIPENEYE